MLFLDSQEEYFNPCLTIQRELSLLLISQVSACSSQQCQHKHTNTTDQTVLLEILWKDLDQIYVTQTTQTTKTTTCVIIHAHDH